MRATFAILAAVLWLTQSTPLPPDYQPSPNPQRAPEQYPGQHDHAIPPEGWFCEPPNPKIDKTPEHPCTCKRMAATKPDGSCILDPDGKEHVIEDPQCSVFCHMDHCKCGVGACDT